MYITEIARLVKLLGCGGRKSYVVKFTLDNETLFRLSSFMIDCPKIYIYLDISIS